MERVRRGDVWVVAPEGFPKPRPALILSIDPVNDLCPEVLLVPCTTREGPLRVAIVAKAEQTGLRGASFAKCESLGPVHKSRLKRKIGRLPHAALQAVEDGVLRVLGLASHR